MAILKHCFATSDTFDANLVIKDSGHQKLELSIALKYHQCSNHQTVFSLDLLLKQKTDGLQDVPVPERWNKNPKCYRN